MKPIIGILDHNIEEVATLLNTLLADEYLLFTKTRNAHWNIGGSNFLELHTFFKVKYEMLNEIIDTIAIRIRSLGHFALGSLKDYLIVTHLLETNYNFGNPKQVIQTLTDDHETIIRSIRNDIIPASEKFKDLGTADFVTDILEQHEKMAWMHRAFLS
jgi:starvation-inducible DNA-binding protein